MPEKKIEEKEAWDFLMELKNIDRMIDTVNLDYIETYMRSQPKGKKFQAAGSLNTNSFTSDVENISEELWQLSQEKERLIKRYAEHKTKFYHIVNKMHTTEYMEILVRYFAKGQNMEDIAEQMNYGRTWTYTARNKAIREFAEYMED